MSNNVLNLSDRNSSENNSGDEKKKVRRNKKTYYHTERENIIQQLKILMKLDNDNSVLLVELRDNAELKSKLISYTDDIKKYYRCSTWVVRQSLQPCHYVG